MSDKENDIKLGFVIFGIVLLVFGAMLLIVLDELDVTRILGVAALFIIGLGLTVAGSPDPREK